MHAVKRKQQTEVTGASGRMAGSIAKAHMHAH